jgi:hypothetical protein
MVIDGQQRLTTFQVFLSFFRDFCRDQACNELAKECESFTLNRGMMPEPEVDKFKVWPTKSARKCRVEKCNEATPQLNWKPKI